MVSGQTAVSKPVVSTFRRLDGTLNTTGHLGDIRVVTRRSCLPVKQARYFLTGTVSGGRAQGAG